MLPPEIGHLLEPPGEGVLLVITVGNKLRADDGAGPFIAAAARPRRGIVVMDAGENPENIFDRAVAACPSRILFIDAADFGGRAGEARLLPPGQLSCHTLSTHRFPLPALGRILTEETGAPAAFLGIQPAGVKFGEGLSREVRRTARELIMLLNGQPGRHPATKG